MGASGMGKSTLLSLAAGECAPCSMVFQDARLVEGSSALDNVLVCADARVDASNATTLLRRLVPGIDVHVRAGSAVVSRSLEPCCVAAVPSFWMSPLPAWTPPRAMRRPRPC